MKEFIQAGTLKVITQNSDIDTYTFLSQTPIV